MFKVDFVNFSKSIQTDGKKNLLQLAQELDIPVYSICAGQGYCLHCKMKILEGKVKQPTKTLLSQEDKKQNFVLGCKSYPLSDLKLFIPDTSIIRQIYIYDKFIKKDNIKLDKVKRIDISFNTLDKEIAQFIAERQKNFYFSLQALKETAKLIAKKQNSYSLNYVALKQDNRYKLIFDKNTKEDKFGVFIDIGSTTISLGLANLYTKEILNLVSKLNTQSLYGEDIISRIMYSEQENNLFKLRQYLINDINSLIKQLNIDIKNIYLFSIAANTTMIYFLLGILPTSLRLSPHKPIFNFLHTLEAKNFKFLANEEALVYILPVIDGFVGADTVAGIISTDLYKTDKINILLDIGTNAEIVLANQDFIITASAPAGPALEGMQISYGLRAIKGAISKIEFFSTGDIKFEVIGNTKAKGICGSGFVDLIANMFKFKVIDKRGNFLFNDLFKDRYVLSEDKRIIAFKITKEVLIYQEDIIKLIESKAAIFTAVYTLIEKIGFNFSFIDKFFIAGSFGSVLDIDNAITIGLLPPINRDKFVLIGNSSLSGAYVNLFQDIDFSFLDNITHIDLSEDISFSQLYSQALFIPHSEFDKFL